MKKKNKPKSKTKLTLLILLLLVADLIACLLVKDSTIKAICFLVFPLLLFQFFARLVKKHNVPWIILCIILSAGSSVLSIYVTKGSWAVIPLIIVKVIWGICYFINCTEVEYAEATVERSYYVDKAQQEKYEKKYNEWERTYGNSDSLRAPDPPKDPHKTEITSRNKEYYTNLEKQGMGYIYTATVNKKDKRKSIQTVEEDTELSLITEGDNGRKAFIFETLCNLGLYYLTKKTLFMIIDAVFPSVFTLYSLVMLIITHERRTLLWDSVKKEEND